VAVCKNNMKIDGLSRELINNNIECELEQP